MTASHTTPEDSTPGDPFSRAAGRFDVGRVRSVVPGEQLTASIMGALMSYVLVPAGPSTRLLLKVVVAERNLAAVALALGDFADPSRSGHLTGRTCTAERIRMTTRTEVSETWQARIGHDLAAQLRRDAELLGLDGRTEIVKAALQLLHRRAAEERMARSIVDFYGDEEPPLPVGVRGGPRNDRSDVTA